MEFTEVLQQASILLSVVVGACYFYQILYLFLPLLHRKTLPPSSTFRRYAILIAARNEEAVLPYLLESIRMQDYPAELIQVFVVADNCTDRTPVVAKEGGAVVFCRHNKAQVGKGYALHFLLERIDESENLDSFDAFLIFDADNLLRPDFVRRIDRVAAAGYAVFCGCRNTKNFGANWISAGHGLWYLHESVHLNHSRMLLGNPCAVNGTGFGFTRDLLRQMSGWNFFTLTEDVEFSTWCVTQGIRSGYCQDAIFYDEQPQKFSQSWRQRTRWIQGGIQVSLRYGSRLLRGILRGGAHGYHCLEASTLLLWGYGTGLLCGVLTLVTALLNNNWAGIGHILLSAGIGSVAAPFAIGVMTLLSQWHKIHATTLQKLLALPAFCLHMITYIPIALCALFQKPRWLPIEHTAALSSKELQ